MLGQRRVLTTVLLKQVRDEAGVACGVCVGGERRHERQCVRRLLFLRLCGVGPVVVLCFGV